MTHQILFIQGGGAGAYEADQQLVVSLRRALGTAYELLYPNMPHESEPDYRNWKTQIGKKLGYLKNGAILVRHSLDGSFLLKYLSDEKVEKAIAGIFLIATPYWGGDGWRYMRDMRHLPCPRISFETSERYANILLPQPR